MLAHQGDGDLCDWMPFARVLAASGYRALAFDFRSYGSSQHGLTALRHLDRDVRGAAAELRRRGATRVLLAGASLDGAEGASLRKLLLGFLRAHSG